MFVFRSLFWLGLIVMLLPPADGQSPPPRVTFVHTAIAARALLADLSGLCDRNPEACKTSFEAMSLVQRKLETGAGIVAAGIDAGRSGDAGDDEQLGTLTPDDLEPGWALEQPQI